MRQLEQDVGPGEKLQTPFVQRRVLLVRDGGCYELREQQDTSGETLESQAKQGSSKYCEIRDK